MKNNAFPLMAAVLFLLPSCATVHDKPVTHLNNPAPAISPTLQQSNERVLKRKVAIARFSNETKQGRSFLLSTTGDQIGKQASDILSTKLAATNKFILLERTDLDKLSAEKNLNGLKIKMKTIPADFLILGSVSEFGREITSDVGIFSRTKKQKARAKVNVRLIKVSTGQIVYSEEASGYAEVEAGSVLGVGNRAGYDSTLNDEAISAAISKLVSNIVENMMDGQWRTFLVGQDGSLYYIAGGKTQGIAVGDKFQVMAKGRNVTNPQTGITMALPGKKIATIQVESTAGDNIDNEVSLCKVIDGMVSQPFDKYYVIEGNRGGQR